MRLALVPVVLLAAVVHAEDKDAAKKDAAALQGTWLIEGLEYNGKSLKGKYDFTFVVKGAELIVEGDGKVKQEYARIGFKLDPSTTPKCIDLKVSGGVQKDAAMEGIYELKGDVLKLCVKVFGNDRPGDFTSPDGGSVALLTLKRQK